MAEFFRSSFRSPNYYDSGGQATSSLIQNLLSIQERKRAAARQQEMDRIAEEDRQRQIKAEDEDRRIKLTQLAQAIAATKERPTQTVEKPVGAVDLRSEPEPIPSELASQLPLEELSSTLLTKPQGTPDQLPLTVKSEEPTPTPSRQLSIGDLDLDVPLYSRSEVQAQQDADARRKMGLEVEKQTAINEAVKTFTVPNDPEKFGEFAGMALPITAMPAFIRSQTQATRALKTVDLGDRVEYYDDQNQLIKTVPRGAPPRDPSQGTGAMKQYTDKRDGSVLFLTNEEAHQAQKEGWLAPGPTSEMRNTAFQAGALEPALDLVGNSLDNLELQQQGVGRVTQLIPGSKASYALSRFRDQAKALLGAIVARQAGEGSRLSDEDRKVYARAATLVDNMLLLPGGVEEARARLNETRALLAKVQQRRAISGAGAGADVPDVPVDHESLPAAPKPGDRKTAKNGRVLVFDGTGWTAEGQ